MSNVLYEYGIDAFAAMLHENAKEKGFWDGETSLDKLGNKLALVHSEVTEVLEAIRKSKGSEAIVEEVADTLIRLLDVYAAMMNMNLVEHSLEEVMNNKIERNKHRPMLHKNLF
jgi:NTP pyrophosphatase (non-canonical NTP hydrolase)